LSIPRAALLVSAAGVVIGAGRRTRIRLPDLALAGLALLFVASFDPGLGVPRGLLIEAIVSISFYAIGRLVGTADTTRLILWALAAGGAVGGLSVMFEFFVTQSPLVSDSSQYGWQQDATYIYRPGGLYGSPPGAVAALSMSTVCALPLIAGERHWRRVFAIGLALLGLAGIILTFTRAGWIGFVVGALLYAVLSADQFKRRAKALLVTAVMLGVAALLVLPSVSGSDLYQKGVDRGGTLQAREGYWQLALPLVADSPKHLFLGRGFSALLSGDSGGNIDSGLMTAPQVTISGTHNQYVKTLVEHGLLGLALFLTWLVGSIAIAARNARIAKGEARRLSAALAGATLSFAIVSLAGDTFRDAQTIAMVSLLAGLGVTLGARSRKSAR
jgi:O-antigen ligase